MKVKITLLISMMITGMVFSSYGQNNNQNDKTKNYNFYKVQKAINDYWEPFRVAAGYYYENGEKKKASGFNQFKRWEWFWKERVDPQTGDYPAHFPADIRKSRTASRGSHPIPLSAALGTRRLAATPTRGST